MGIPSVSDAESLEAKQQNSDYKDKMWIFHYGYVRSKDIILDKSIDMQSWFRGDRSVVDVRLYKQKKEGVFNSIEFIPDKELLELKMKHPMFAKSWVEKKIIKN